MKNKNLSLQLFVIVGSLLCLVHSAFAAYGEVSYSYETIALVPGSPAEAVQEPEKHIQRNAGTPSQEQKDATAAVCQKVAENRKEFYEPYGISENLFLTTCYQDLLAIAYAESRFDCSVVGDQGRSHGCFQIQTKLHGVSVENATDYAWAAEWTLDRMVRDYQYPRFRTLAIERHNGAGLGAEMYAKSVIEKSNDYK